MDETSADFVKRIKRMLTVFAEAEINSGDTLSVPGVLVLPELTPHATKLCIEAMAEVTNSLVVFYVGPESNKRSVVCNEALIRKKLIEDSTQSTEEMLRIPGSSRSSSACEPPAVFMQPEDDELWTRLDSVQLSDIHRTVGLVNVIKPEWENFDYDMSIPLNHEDVSHIVEAYDFSARLKSSDFDRILFLFRNEYDIVWVDDTHLLLICKNALTANAILELKHQLLNFKVRPATVASRQSKRKIMKNKYSCLPPKERPPALPTAARRTILRCLDIPLPKSALVLENDELKRLQQAKDELQREKKESAEGFDDAAG